MMPTFHSMLNEHIMVVISFSSKLKGFISCSCNQQHVGESDSYIIQFKDDDQSKINHEKEKPRSSIPIASTNKEEER